MAKKKASKRAISNSTPGRVIGETGLESTLTKPSPSSTNHQVENPAGVATDVVNKSNSEATSALLNVEITVVFGSLTQVASPIAVAPRYQGVGLVGATGDFDRKLDFWLTRIFDVGIVSSILGQISLLPLADAHAEATIEVKNLFLVGLGEPGMFAEDDLRFLISNVVVAVYALGYRQFSIPLIGSRRKEMLPEQAIRGLLHGIEDGTAIFRSMFAGVQRQRENYRNLLERRLRVSIVEDVSSQWVDDVTAAFKIAASQISSETYKISVQRGPDAKIEPKHEPPPPDVDPDIPVTLLRVTKKPGKPLPLINRTGDLDLQQSFSDAEVFEFSALGESAAMAVREQEISSYFLRELPKRLSKAGQQSTQREMGMLFLKYLIPDDLRQFIQSAKQLCVIVDSTTASYPWEMAAFNNHRQDHPTLPENGQTCWLGTSLRLSRRFHTLRSAAPGAPPPISRSLRVLIIADPAPGTLSLEKAREEGLAVVQALRDAQRHWGNEYVIKACVRIGSYTEPDKVAKILDQLRPKHDQDDVVESAEVCDPMELLARIVNGSFDVIHFAGHGMFDEEHDRAGWIFDRGCLLTAREICRVRQVPRLVFANACFSSKTEDDRDQDRQQIVGLAQAFFARGIQNYIGTGWKVDDDHAAQFARTFYRSLLGSSSAPPATIGMSLAAARVEIQKAGGTTWGAYQHYGNANDKLLPVPNIPQDRVPANVPPPSSATAPHAQDSVFQITAPLQSPPPTQASNQPPTKKRKPSDTDVLPGEADLIYVNGIDPDTGGYALPPVSIADLCRQIKRDKIDLEEVLDHSKAQRSVPFEVSHDLDDLSLVGWGIIFSKETPASVRAALAPLIEHRRKQAGNLVKELVYNKNEMLRDWYQRYNITIGSPAFEVVPYYLMIVGPPESIPFEFQYLLGVEYAVGRIALSTPAEYSAYVKSVIDYESAGKVQNERKIVYWGTSHDSATSLSSDLLISPLANGFPDNSGQLKEPVHKIVGFEADVYLEEEATRAQLIDSISAKHPPALLFTASHGMAIAPGSKRQPTTQGGLICQDWPGVGPVHADQYLTAADIPDSANVHGLIAILFGCFSAGTPDRDQFVKNLTKPNAGDPPAKKPFMSALPQRLLSHPGGGALAVIGHIDRAWSFSIQPANSIGSHIGPFRNGLGEMMKGQPLGMMMSLQFGQRYSTLSTVLANNMSPTSINAKLDDNALVTLWIERNDAQNYVLLGDPAVRIRVDAFVASE